MNKVNLKEKFNLIDQHWQPRIVAALNGQLVKLAKIKGEFVWHTHDNEDELFLVLKGEMIIQHGSKAGAEEIHLREGEFCVVPRGVEHKPIAHQEAHILLFEPGSTLNTGNVRDDRTVEQPDWI